MVNAALNEELHRQLLAERERLEEEIRRVSTGVSADLFQDNESDALDQHPADDASELFEREKNLSVQRTLETSLQAVNDSLRKFDDGTYGTCDNCGKPISEPRLRALPEATLCIDCQSRLEREA